MRRQLILIAVLLVLTPGTFVLAAKTATPSKKPVAHKSISSQVLQAAAANALASTKTVAKSSKSAAPTNTSTASDAQTTLEVTRSGVHLLSSLVNIVCLSGDPSIPSISGTGVMIDSRGIVLTAAHVAQLFLLQDYLGTSKVQCILRTGAPARRAYLAEPIYVSKSWLRDNPNTLTTSEPKGSGQFDIALLGITDTATSTPLPTSFTATPLATTDPVIGQPVAIGGYGAQYLSSTELNYSLFPILLFTTVQSRYTFGSGAVDVISVNGSAAAQEGSSGGGIVDAQGNLIGTITTSAVAGTITDRILNAVTPQHLRATYLYDTGNDLDAMLASMSVPQLIRDYANEARLLGSQLDASIEASKH